MVEYQDSQATDTHLKPMSAKERSRYQFELDFGYEFVVNI